MKIRNGFVSNSSSSSFVVLLPDNFDITSFVEENWQSVDLSDFDFDEEEVTDEASKAKVDEIVRQFIEDGEVSEYDDNSNLYIIRELFHDYIVADIDVSSDSGSGMLLDNAVIKKILGC